MDVVPVEKAADEADAYYGFSLWTRWSFAVQDVIDSNIYRKTCSVVARLASSSANDKYVQKMTELLLLSPEEQKNKEEENREKKEITNSLIIYVCADADN